MSWTEKIVSMSTTCGICAETVNAASNMQNEQNNAACSPTIAAASCTPRVVISLLRDQGTLCLAFGARL